MNRRSFVATLGATAATAFVRPVYPGPVSSVLPSDLAMQGWTWVHGGKERDAARRGGAAGVSCFEMGGLSDEHLASLSAAL